MHIFDTMNTGIESFANVISQFEEVIMYVVSIPQPIQLYL